MIAASVEAGRDAAWVSVDTPLSLPALRGFCEDIERLLRINPCLEFQRWRRTGDAAYHAVWRNLSNRQQVTQDMRIERESADAFALVYAAGIKRRTRFVLEAAGAGSRLIITDDYSGSPEAERERRLHEVDKSLTAWGWALSEYLRREQRWGRNPLWRSYMRRVWLPMTPRARRIVYMLVLLTLAELALILLVGTIYWLEHRG